MVNHGEKRRNSGDEGTVERYDLERRYSDPCLYNICIHRDCVAKATFAKPRNLMRHPICVIPMNGENKHLQHSLSRRVLYCPEHAPIGFVYIDDIQYVI
jgi:hypothetical protein